jgi:glycosyltransferase involved in cell wall biosynthesis
VSRRIKLVGLTLGDPFDPASRSGVNYKIFSKFREQFELLDVFDLDIGGVWKLILAAKNFSFDRRTWGNKLHQNPLAFNIRTDMAGKKLEGIEYKFDLIYQDGAMFMPGWIPKAPYVSYHDSNVILSAKGKPYSQGAHYTKRNLDRTVQQEKMVYQNASLVFSMSDWLKRSLIEDFGIPEEKIITVYAGTNLEVEDFEKCYDGRTILFVGRNFERKGGKTLLEAFKLVRKEIKDATLITIGSTLNIDLEGVQTLGPIKDKNELTKYFQQASIFALPSLYEPFGIVFAEAFAYKTPCVGTNICAMPEIIEEGKGGFVVPVNDHKMLAKRIIEILRNKNLAREMGNYGFKKAKTMFNWGVVAEKMLLYCSRIV